MFKSIVALTIILFLLACSNARPAKATPTDQREAYAEASRRVQEAGREGMKGVEYKGGDGSSDQNAVVIANVANVFGCVSAQYAWLDKYYPGYQFIMHTGGEKDGKRLSVISFLYKGQQKKIYFDITECK